MRLKRTFLASLLAIPALLFTNLANATPVTGAANIAGNVTVQDGTIAFTPAFTTAGAAQETGAYSGLTGGTIATLTGGPTTGFITPIVGFVNFNVGVTAPVTFDLNYIAPGVGTLAGCSSSALGASCTPSGSPFTLFQLSSNTVVATLQLNGIGYTGSSATGSSPTTSIFTTQSVINGTIPQIAGLLASGGAVSATYSASFASTPGPTVPEPASMLLMGVGLVGAGLVARRKVRS